MNMQHTATYRVAWGLLLVLVFSVFALAQDVSTIKGKVIDKNTGEALQNTNVTLVGTKLGAATDKQGIFVIKAPIGSYQIKVSYIGYESINQEIIVEANQNLDLNFALKEDFFQTEQVVVTATRTEKLLQDVPIVTEFISREEIEEKGAEDLSEVLEDRPGIAVESGTSGGKFVYMNGVDSRRILVLVDGVPLSGKLNNRIQMNLIDSDKIDHVEIVKGPGSALYGNDAMGGVINIITRDYTKNLKVQANGRTGSNDLYSGNISVSGGTDQLGYYMDVDHFREGYDQGASEIKINETQTNSLTGKIKYQHGLLGSFELSGDYRDDQQDSESQFMGSMRDNLSKVRNVGSNLRWAKSFNKLSVQTVGYYGDNLRSYESVTRGSTHPSSPDTTTDSMIGLKSDISFQANKMFKIDAGFDYSDNDYDNPRLSDVQKREQTGIFGQLESQFFNKLTVIVGGRYDKITDIETNVSPKVSGLFSITSDLKLRASWGKGFRAPSFIELYSNFPIPIPGMPMMIVGNEDLKPEKSTGSNIGLEYFWNSFMLLNVNYFQNEFEDMIVDYQPMPLTFSYLNVDNATFKGIELQGRFYLLDNLTTTIGYNYTDIAQADEDVAFSQISPHTASLRVKYGMFKNRLKVSVREQFFSEREILIVARDGSFNKVQKGNYDVLDLTVSYKVNQMLSLMVGSTNLTDHVDLDYGPYIGRRFFFGIQTGI